VNNEDMKDPEQKFFESLRSYALATIVVSASRKVHDAINVCDGDIEHLDNKCNTPVVAPL
jgi:hypothetical protein